MADLEIVHAPGRGNRVTRANRRQIYKFLEERDPHEVGMVIIRVVGRMEDHKTRERLLLLTQEFNNELAIRDSLWRVKSLRVRFTREGEFSTAELHDYDMRWSAQLMKRGWVELSFGPMGVSDL